MGAFRPRVTAEMIRAVAVGAAHKKKFEGWLAGRFSAAGIGASEALARQVAVLMDGAFPAMLTHRDPGHAEAAAKAARELVRHRLGTAISAQS